MGKNPKNPKLKLALFIILYALAALFIMSLVQTPGIVNKVSGVISNSEFEGYTPYQYRVLMPLLIRGTEAITPSFIKDYIDSKLGSYLDSKFRQDREDIAEYKVDRLSKYGYRVFLYLGFTYLALLFYLILLRRFAIDLKLFKESACDLIPLVMVLILPTYYSWTLMFYDYTHLLLFSLALYLMYKQKWSWFILVYFIGSVNKESMFFIPIAFAAFYYDKLPRSLLVKLLSAQVLITLAVKAAVYYVFKDNPGGFVVFALERNINRLSELSTYLDFSPIGKGMLMPIYLNIPLPRGLNIPMFAVFLFFIIYGWNRKPEFLKKSIYYFPLLVIMALIWGFVDEFRAYYDILTIVFFISLAGVKYAFDDLRARKARD